MVCMVPPVFFGNRRFLPWRGTAGSVNFPSRALTTVTLSNMKSVTWGRRLARRVFKSARTQLRRFTGAQPGVQRAIISAICFLDKPVFAFKGVNNGFL